MKGLAMLVIAVLLIVGIGVGVLGLTEEPAYQLGEHAFQARFPIPISTYSTRDSETVDVHGLNSPPEFRVQLAVIEHRNLSELATRALPVPSVVIVPAKHLRGGSLKAIPDATTSRQWELTMVNGFVREVSIYRVGNGYWRGVEVTFTERAGFAVSATSTSISQVRAFLDSFVPLR